MKKVFGFVGVILDSTVGAVVRLFRRRAACPFCGDVLRRGEPIALAKRYDGADLMVHRSCYKRAQKSAKRLATPKGKPGLQNPKKARLGTVIGPREIRGER